jgi:hypothetical protein
LMPLERPRHAHAPKPLALEVAQKRGRGGGGAPLSPWGARSDAHFKTHRASRNVLLAPSLVSSEVSFTSCPTNSNAHFKTNRASCNRRSLKPAETAGFLFPVQPCLPTLWIWNMRNERPSPCAQWDSALVLLLLRSHLDTTAAGRLPSELQHHSPHRSRRGSDRRRRFLFRALNHGVFPSPFRPRDLGWAEGFGLFGHPTWTFESRKSEHVQFGTASPRVLRVQCVMPTPPCGRCAANAVVPTLPSTRGQYYRCQTCGQMWHVDALPPTTVDDADRGRLALSTAGPTCVSSLRLVGLN